MELKSSAGGMGLSAEEPGVGLEATPDATAGALVAIGCELPEEEDAPGCELPPEEDAPDGAVCKEAKVAAARSSSINMPNLRRL